MPTHRKHILTGQVLREKRAPTVQQLTRSLAKKKKKMTQRNTTSPNGVFFLIPIPTRASNAT